MKTAVCLVPVCLVIGIAVAQDKNQQQNDTKSTRASAAQSAQSYKGTLVDASCAAPGTGTAASTSTSQATQQAPDSSKSK